MKTLKPILTVVASLFCAFSATANTYLGSWTNKTFNSTGALKIELTHTKTNVTGSLDLDGPVFGSIDPPAIPFSAALDSSGSGNITVTSTAIGNLSGRFTSDGSLTLNITKIPGGFLTKTVITGKFDLGIEKFTGTYQIYTASGVYANGVADAHVHKVPVLKVPGTVVFSGTSKTIQAKVVTNTGIRSFKATTTSTARITVTGTNPYQINARNLPAANIVVKVTVTNADGLHTTKYVKFVKG